MGINRLFAVFVFCIAGTALAQNYIVTSTDQKAANGTMVNAILANGRATGISVNPGLITLGTKNVAAPVTGVQVGDNLTCSLAGASPLAAGASMTMCSVTAADTVTFQFVTPIAIGVTLGASTYNVTWFR